MKSLYTKIIVLSLLLVSVFLIPVYVITGYVEFINITTMILFLAHLIRFKDDINNN